MQFRDYVKVTSVEEAYNLNQKKTNVIVGGMHWLKMSKRNAGTAIDMSGLGLDEITETDEAFEIGAMVSLRQLELHEGLNAYSKNAVKNALEDIVGVQFRNTATVGGSIFGRYGFSDVLTVFLAMDTYVELYKGGIIPLGEFADMKRDRDVLVKIIVKKKDINIAYIAERRTKTDFPVLNCAVSSKDGKWCAVVGARPGKAVCVTDENAIIGTVVTEETAVKFAEYATEKLKFSSNIRGSEEYRKLIAPVLIKRALLKAGKEQ